MRAVARALLALCLFGATAAVATDFRSALPLGAFSRGNPTQGLPTGWQPLTFGFVELHTEYRLVRDEDAVVLRAHAEDAGSGLQRKLAPDVGGYRHLRWRWKIARPLAEANIALEQRDDAAARMLVIYAYDPERLSLVQRALYSAARAYYGKWPPHAVLTYVWARRHPEGAVLANPLTERARAIVLEDADTPPRQWVSEQRDVYADYKRAFGEEPPPIAAIAVMTDTDVTGETATAWYGDIVLAP